MQREDFYLAQIAYRIALGQVSDPTKLHIQQFLFNYKPVNEISPVEEIIEREDISDEEKKRMVTERSKRAWAAGLGATK
jgi:hypothetical protein